MQLRFTFALRGALCLLFGAFKILQGIVHAQNNQFVQRNTLIIADDFHPLHQRFGKPKGAVDKFLPSLSKKGNRGAENSLEKA